MFYGPAISQSNCRKTGCHLIKEYIASDFSVLTDRREKVKAGVKGNIFLH